jgi:uncharacterized repeat protein (TIGR04138 family)
MHTSNLDGALDSILQKDPRYHRDAYQFVREALDYTQRMGAKGGKNEPRPAQETRKTRGVDEQHVTGQQLLAGIRAFALETFGPMALAVLHEWGIRRCEDFGEIVFLMIDHNLLGKTDRDRPEDFSCGYDFDEAFRQPFVPSATAQNPTVEPKPNGA